jgi:hypothetical protein
MKTGLIGFGWFALGVVFTKLAEFAVSRLREPHEAEREAAHARGVRRQVRLEVALDDLADSIEAPMEFVINLRVALSYYEPETMDASGWWNDSQEKFRPFLTTAQRSKELLEVRAPELDELVRQAMVKYALVAASFRVELPPLDELVAGTAHTKPLDVQRTVAALNDLHRLFTAIQQLARTELAT